MPTHARHAVGQLFLGSVAFEVARRSPIPMVVLGPDASLPDDRAPLDEILVCLDGSTAGERALGPAATMARTFGLALALGEVRRPDVVTVSGDVTEDAYLTRVAQSADPPIDRWDVVADTRPADGIAELATGRPGAALALATHARKVGERFREGSVAVDVIRAATAPVLIVGPRCRAGVR
jgi:nucleotide-binding universal stress UspA family protein